MRAPSFPSLKLVLMVALALAATGSAGAWAQEPPPRERGDDGARGAGQDARMPRSRGGEDPLSDSVRRFERSNRGSRVLSAERMQSDGRDVNRIKAMDDRGRVRVYVDDPQRQRPQPPRERPARDDND